MKYSDTNPPLICMMTRSTCYQGTSTGTPIGVLWHDTAGRNPNADPRGGGGIFCAVSDNRGASDGPASRADGLAPFGCI